MNIPLWSTTTSHPGLIALGPTRDERDILNQCCNTLDTQLFYANDTACLRTAECPVIECSERDPSYTCVAMQRRAWMVEGTFGCVEGRKSGAMRKGVKMWFVLVGVMVGVVGMGGGLWGV
jgi:hypothetical protein